MSEPADDATLEGSLPVEGRARPDDPPPSFGRGAAIGRYVLLAQVGAGAMGMVFAAYDPELDRRVALKLLRPRGSLHGRARERMQREAQALAKLAHPNVVGVHDVGVHDEQLFIAMEFVEGRTLSQWMAAAPKVSSGADASPGAPVRTRPWREVLEVFAQAGRGLAAAHEAGFVHRDFKPDNVMLSADGRVRVMDFGLARVEEETSERVDPSERVDSLTQTGALVGTPAYMSLEQFGGGSVDARSDQFGFCVALHEALYGERPFAGETLGELVHALHEGVVRAPARSASVPGWVRAVVLRGLATKPEERFPSMQALLEALAADPVARRRRIAARLGLGLALVVGGWGVISLSGEVEQRDAKIEEQAGELEDKTIELEARLVEETRLLSKQRGLRASMLVGTENEAEALLLSVQAVGAYAGAWEHVPREAVEGLEQVLAHDTIDLEASHVLRGHGGYVSAAVYSPDGLRLATSSYDGTVRLWDPVRAEPITTLEARGGAPIFIVAFSPDGTRLATGSDDGTAQLWDARSGEPLVTLDGHEGRVHTLVFSSDGTRVATAANEPDVRVWDASTGARLLTLADEGAGDAHDFAYAHDGLRIVTASADAKARVWDARTGARLVTLVGHEGPVRAVAIAPDGTRVATASEDRRARLWELDSGAPLAILEGHLDRVSAVAFSPDGRRVTTASWDKTGRVYDAASGKLLGTLEGGHGAGIVSLVYAPDGASLATSSYGGNVALWDAATSKLRARLRGHRADVWSVAFAPGGRGLATASVDTTVRLWDLGQARVVAVAGPETDVQGFTYARDGSQLATLSTDGRLRLWASETGALVRTLDDDAGTGEASLAFSPDGSRLAVGHRGRVHVWDPRTGELRLDTPSSRLAPAVIYSPRGTLLLVSDGPTIRIFDADTQEALATLEHEQLDPRPVFSPDDARLAIATDADVVRLWDPRTGVLLDEVATPGEGISSVIYSPSGTELVTAGVETGLRIWDAQRLTLRATLPGPPEVASPVYSPDGARLAGGSGLEGVWLWDAASGEVLRRIAPDDGDTGTGIPMFSPDGRRLVVIGSGSGFLRIYDVATGERLQSIDRVLATHYELSPNGKRLTTVDSKHALEVWDVETGEPLTRERIGLVRADGTIAWPVPPGELLRIGCARLRVFERSYAEARDVCEPKPGK